ncbi:MAG: TonB-dependent receptor plug domain-containing protein [Desulfatiglans sp.]|nr:TonB-dependent receptor plug domain-containing protein [Desulfatiglans sp.]
MEFRYRKLVKISVILTSLALAPYAVAGDDEEKEEKASKKQTAQAQQVEPMTVVDKPVSMREDLDPSSITNIYRIEKSAQFGTEVFTEEDIKNLQPSNFFDLVENAVGINVTYQGRKQPFFVSQRGGGNFTYIIDGAVLPSSINRILYKFPVSAIEEMQVVRGSTSLSLGPSIPIGSSNSGSGINTGYIIIRTKQPKKTEAILSGSIEKSVGDQPTATSESLYLGTRHEWESGVNLYGGVFGAASDRPSKTLWFDGRKSKGGMVNMGLNIGKFNINTMAYKDSGDFEMQRGVTFDGTIDNAKWYYDPLKSEVFSTDMGVQWTPNQTTIINLFQTKFEQLEHNGSFINSTMRESTYDEETKGMGIRHNAIFGNTLFQAGGQISKSNGVSAGSKWSSYDTRVTGFSTSLEQKFYDGNLTLDAGYRQDKKHIDESGSEDVNEDLDMAPSKVYALGAFWKITDTYTMNGRYYKGKQGTVGDFDMRLEGDATPHPENQERIELSVSAEYASYFRPSLTWYDIDIKNKKSSTSNTYDLNGSTYYYYSESDELRRGLEVMIQGTVLKNTTYKASWTRTLDNESKSEGITTDSIGKSNPEDLYTFALTHKWDQYKANVSIRKVDEWQNSSSPMGTAQYGGLGGYTRIDANISRDFVFNNIVLNTTLFGRNIGNEHYSTRYVTGYYPDRGRTIGIELSFIY